MVMPSESGWIDISYPIWQGMAIYPGNPGVNIDRVQDIKNGDSANVSRISIGSHTGTHIDAPAHFIAGGETLDQISLDRMNGKAKVFDLSGHNNIEMELLQDLPIEKDDIILFRTDNSDNWSCDRILDDYVTLTYEAAKYLADLEIKLVGIDYLTIERPRSKRENGKSIHDILLGRDVLITEALRLKSVKEGKYYFLCLPLRIEGMDGIPTRSVIININNLTEWL